MVKCCCSSVGGANVENQQLWTSEIVWKAYEYGQPYYVIVCTNHLHWWAELGEQSIPKANTKGSYINYLVKVTSQNLGSYMVRNFCCVLQPDRWDQSTGEVATKRNEIVSSHLGMSATDTFAAAMLHSWEMVMLGLKASHFGFVVSFHQFCTKLSRHKSLPLGSWFFWENRFLLLLASCQLESLWFSRPEGQRGQKTSL